MQYTCEPLKLCKDGWQENADMRGKTITFLTSAEDCVKKQE